MPKSSWKRSHQSSGSETLFFLKSFCDKWVVGAAGILKRWALLEDVIQQGSSQVCVHNFLLSVPYIRYCPTSYESNRSLENWTLWVKAVEEDRGWLHRCQISFEISIREETPWVLLLHSHLSHRLTGQGCYFIKVLIRKDGVTWGPEELSHPTQHPQDLGTQARHKNLLSSALIKKQKTKNPCLTKQRIRKIPLGHRDREWFFFGIVLPGCCDLPTWTCRAWTNQEDWGFWGLEPAFWVFDFLGKLIY